MSSKDQDNTTPLQVSHSNMYHIESDKMPLKAEVLKFSCHGAASGVMGSGSLQNGLQLLAAIGRSFPDDAQSSGGMVRCRTSWSWPCILRFNKLFNISINRDEINICIFIYIIYIDM